MNHSDPKTFTFEVPKPRDSLAVKVATDLPKSVAERLDSAAKEHGITRAELMRALIEGYVKSY